jgi:hypothetical protein
MEKPHLHLAKSYWKDHLKPQDLAIDATCGNGHDTLYLSSLCEVIGLDIQQKALENTKNLLEQNGKRATLLHLPHEKIDTLKVEPSLIVYNLGYLPRGDKSITTKVASTLESVRKGLALLKKGGALCITCYPGHEEGEKEESALMQWLKTLSSKEFLICHHRWLNREKAPSLIWLRLLEHSF